MSEKGAAGTDGQTLTRPEELCSPMQPAACDSTTGWYSTVQPPWQRAGEHGQQCCIAVLWRSWSETVSSRAWLRVEHLQLLMHGWLCSADLRLVLLLQDGVEDVQHSHVLQGQVSMPSSMSDLQPQEDNSVTGDWTGPSNSARQQILQVKSLSSANEGSSPAAHYATCCWGIQRPPRPAQLGQSAGPNQSGGQV